MDLSRLSVTTSIVLAVAACSLILAAAFLQQPRSTVSPAEADDEIVAFLGDYAARLAQTRDFNGVVLYARGETVLFHEAYGVANRETSTPNEISTRFNLASASKMFTAVAIGKLVEEGKLSLDDRIGMYLGSEWVSAQVGETVLVRHLLNHTSGLGSYWGEKWDAFSAEIETIDGFQKVISDELAFKPGSRMSYSSTGYILLGAIIERITGETYYDYVRRTIFEPSGMTSTGFEPTNLAQEDFAVGYFRDAEEGGELKDNLALHGARGASAGGGWSTTSDLHRFFLAMSDNRIVTASTRALLWSPKPVTPRWGYGFEINNQFSGPGWVGHDGGFPGIQTFVYYHPATGHTLVILSNYGGSALPLMRAMERQFRKHYGSNKVNLGPIGS